MIRSRRPSQSEPTRGLEIDRRRFLAMTGAGAALGVMPGIVGAALPVEYPMSVAYLEGSDRLASLAELPWRFEGPAQLAVPATEIPSGEPSFALELLRLRVAGFYPDWPWPAKQRPNAVDLDVLFEPFDPAAPSPLPFAAWSYRRLPARNLSPPVAFNFTMEASDGLGLRLRCEDRNRRTSQTATAFTVDDTEGLPRLQRGIYLLGLLPGTFDRECKIPGAGDPPDYALRSLVLSVEALDLWDGPQGDGPSLR